MKGLFGIGSKLKDKFSAQRFEFTVTIHNLQPWPESGNKAVAIGWQRGKDKRGGTRSVYPSPQPGKLGNVARFNEKFELSATLYRASSGPVNQNQLGPFKKKCLILAILETDGRTQATAALGRVVIDLSEFAAHEKQEVRFFMVSCNRQIQAAVGDPQLLITIRTRLKKVSQAIRGDGDVRDDGSAMSADTTGSRMTDNLSTFLRHKFTGKGPVQAGDNEQDLTGFTPRGMSDHMKLSQKTRDTEKAMNAIDESQEDDELGTADPFAKRIGQAPAKAGLPPRGPTAARPYGSDGMNGHGASDGVRQPYGVGRTSPMVSTIQSGSPRATLDDTGSTGAPTPNAANRAMGVAGIAHSNSMSAMAESTSNELMTIAASEMTVHMAKSVAAQSKRLDRAAHAAARRIVRTLVCLGPQQAPVFGQHALRLIHNQIESNSTDLSTLAFWWSNLAHMRALLQQCSSSAAMPAQVADVLMPQIQNLERTAFDQVLTFLWEGVLLPTVTDSAATARAPGATAASKRAQQEAAIKRWFEALRAVNTRLSAMVAFTAVGRQRTPVAGHVPQLRQQALLQCLKRVDALLFYHLVMQPGRTPPDIMGDYDPSHSIWGAPGTPAPALEDSSLPFVKGVLTFGSGMSVKMTVTRLQQWATTEGGIPETGGGAGPNSSALFPLLRAAADLLMMPKELLMEATIRRDVTQALSIRSMQQILAAFQPDEYAVDAISPDILRTLQEEEVRFGNPRPTLTDLSVAYKPPADEVILTRVNQGIEPSVEYDADSEDELVGFSGMAAPPGCGSRFRLLHDLWYSGARFREAASISSSSRMGSTSAY